MLLFLLGSCSYSVDTSLAAHDPEETFSLLMQECIDHSFGAVAGVSMSINSPLLKQKWSGAAGFADQELNKKLEASFPFRIASVTKTYVAAAILRLHEMDSISIDEPIANFLDASFISMLESDNYDPDKILIRHCLNHTSGLADYVFGSELFVKEIIKNPQKRWTRKDQLEIAMQGGEKLGEAGTQTTYSDTGYILLGLVIENFYDGDLAKGLRELLNFDELGLSSTWLETLEEKPVDDTNRVHRYMGKFDATDWDASIDLYGGGGLVSTTSDLADFCSALFDNKVYEKEATLDLMMSVPRYITHDNYNDKKKIEFYNYGLWTIKTFGKKVHMHTGYWGVTLLHIPDYNTSIAVNTTRGNSDRLIKKVILVLKQLNDNQ